MSIPTIAVAAMITAAGPSPGGNPAHLSALAAIGDAPAAAASAAPPQEETLPPDAGTESPPAAAQRAPASGVPANDKAAAVPPVANADAKTSGRKEIVVEGEAGPPPGDPIEAVNIQTFEVVQAVDKALVEPVAHGYMKIVPKPIRDGLHNVLTNLDEPIIFLSFLLQLKPLKALETLGRLAINSTIGLGGLFDVAKDKPFNHPHEVNGLGYTLAYYGVKPGPFLYLPLIGSTTLRDLIGQLAALPLLPLTIGKPFNQSAYVIPKFTLDGIDDRVQDDERLTKIRNESSNPYAAYRSYYLRKRQAEVDVLRGKRDNADVPVFEDEVPEGGDAPPAGEAAAPASGNLAPANDAPAEGAHMPIDETAVLAE